MFDIVILVGPNDIDIINKQIEFTKKNIIGYRKIYIISNYISKNIEGCEIISEKIFEFNNDDVIQYMGNINRTKWYLQQLFKLYVYKCIPDLLDKYLVIDSDTFFIKPTTFISDDNIALFNVGSEYHIPYFEHMKKLHPSLVKVIPQYSGISHHMLFEKQYLSHLFKLVEENNDNQEFWKIFLNSINPNEYNNSGASEYELYFNFMLIYYPDNIRIRILNFKNVENLDIINYVENPYNYVAYHWYLR